MVCILVGLIAGLGILFVVLLLFLSCGDGTGCSFIGCVGELWDWFLLGV